MSAEIQGTAVVIMGVSGAGKSTIGGMLAEVLNCTFLDADDFHSQSNKEKMKRGIPLSDEDRIPWLETLRDALETSVAGGKMVILGCSALQKHYREILRSAGPNYKTSARVVKFVLLDVPPEVLVARVERRAKEGKHFMPATLLQSQLNSLQIDECEGIIKVDASQGPHDVVRAIRHLIQ